MDNKRRCLFQQQVLLEEVEVADSFRTRFVGLMGRTTLGPNKALYLAPCRSVHTFFVRFPLDLVFLSRDGRVVRVVRDVPPWRFVFGGQGAFGVLELEAGSLTDALGEGDHLTLTSAAT